MKLAKNSITSSFEYTDVILANKIGEEIIIAFLFFLFFTKDQKKKLILPIMEEHQFVKTLFRSFANIDRNWIVSSRFNIRNFSTIRPQEFESFQKIQSHSEKIFLLNSLLYPCWVKLASMLRNAKPVFDFSLTNSERINIEKCLLDRLNIFISRWVDESASRKIKKNRK